VLNSTCNDLNTTGCCVQAPASNLTLAQFGLGVSGGPAYAGCPCEGSQQARNSPAWGGSLEAVAQGSLAEG